MSKNGFFANSVSFSMHNTPERCCRSCGATTLPEGSICWVKINKYYFCCEECEYIEFPHLRAKREKARQNPDRFKGITFDIGYAKQPDPNKETVGFDAYLKRKHEQDNWFIKSGPAPLLKP